MFLQLSLNLASARRRPRLIKIQCDSCLSQAPDDAAPFFLRKLDGKLLLLSLAQIVSVTSAPSEKSQELPHWLGSIRICSLSILKYRSVECPQPAGLFRQRTRPRDQPFGQAVVR